MNTPDTEDVQRGKKYSQVEITEHPNGEIRANGIPVYTPDTDWESGYDAMVEDARLYSDFPDPLAEHIKKYVRKERSSRDTYWKERVRKAVGKIEESARTQDTSYEYGEGTYEGMMHSIFILKDITNEDNLK